MNPPKSEQTDRIGATANRLALPSIVRNLGVLLEQGARFSTIYADPPWPYSNRASRGAAENHYRTMPLEAICDEPVEQLAADNAHLHLWSTNAFLREAFDVIEAWGFQYKSCLIWTKPQLGMGNYWRVSHTSFWGSVADFPFATILAKAGFPLRGPFTAASHPPSGR